VTVVFFFLGQGDILLWCHDFVIQLETFPNEANDWTYFAHVLTPTVGKDVSEVTWLNETLLNLVWETFIKTYCPSLKNSTAEGMEISDYTVF
jgi:hypothetical protein